MILLLDVVSPIPEFHLINENNNIHSLKIIRNNNQKLSDSLIPAYIEINNTYNLDNNLKKLIITIGPGSYTALRVGASFIAGISQSMDLPVSLFSSETIYNFIYEDNKRIAIYFESSNNQNFLTYKKKSLFINTKIENDKYLFSTPITHILYNKSPPNFIKNEIITDLFSIKKIVLENLSKLYFSKNIIIKPIYISNNSLLN